MKQSLGPQGLFFPNPVFVVGTYDSDGRPNAITVAWGGVVSSNPPAISIAVRPSRYSFENLMERRAFTINLPAVDQASEADYFGVVSGRKVDKFKATGLTPVKGDVVDAPYIAEFPYNLECVVTQTLDLGSHVLFIGEVKETHAEDTLVGENGDLLYGNNILTFDSGIRSYRAPGGIVARAFDIGLGFTDRD